MPRVSAADKLERSLTDRLQAMIEDPATPAYVQHRCMATLATMLRRRDKRLEAKAAAAAARRAEKAKANPPSWPSLPERETEEQYSIRVARQMGR